MFWNYSIAFAATFIAAWLIRPSRGSSTPSRVVSASIAIGVSLGGGLLLVLLVRETYAQLRAEFGVPLHVDLGRHFIQFFGASAIGVYLVLRSRVGSFGRADHPIVDKGGASTVSTGSRRADDSARLEPLQRVSDSVTDTDLSDALNPSEDLLMPRSMPPAPRSPGEVLLKPAPAARAHQGDDWAYRIVADELNAGRQDAALWLKAFVHANGDVNRQKVSYIKSRVAILLAEERAKRLHAETIARAGQEEARREFEEWFRKQTYTAPIAIAEMERLVELAIASKAALTIRDLTGKTLLHLAAQCGAATAVERLLNAGAEPNSPDGTGLGPRDYAEASGEHATLAALRRVGATRRPW